MTAGSASQSIGGGVGVCHSAFRLSISPGLRGSGLDSKLLRLPEKLPRLEGRHGGLEERACTRLGAAFFPLLGLLRLGPGFQDCTVTARVLNSIVRT